MAQPDVNPQSLIQPLTAYDKFVPCTPYAHWSPLPPALLVADGHTGGVLSMSWLPDGILLASASDDGSVRIWDVSSFR